MYTKSFINREKSLRFDMRTVPTSQVTCLKGERCLKEVYLVFEKHNLTKYSLKLRLMGRGLNGVHMLIEFDFLLNFDLFLETSL